jgi:hypothetical protein
MSGTGDRQVTLGALQPPLPGPSRRMTIGWMTIEAIVAIASGWAAGSLVLIAFGLDSVIELASAGVLMWRLSVELRRGQTFCARAERTAS